MPKDHTPPNEGLGAEVSAVLDIEGMSCASCVGRVQTALQQTPGVVAADVNLATEAATVTWRPDQTSAAAIADAITSAGYHARPRGGTTHEALSERKAAEASALRRDVILSACLTLPVVFLAMGAHVVPALEAAIGLRTSWGIQLVLTTLVLIGPGRQFFDHGIRSLARRAPDMNALVAMGTGAAWTYSTLAVFAPGLFPDGTRAVYFEAAAVICTLILLGRWLEARAKGRTGAAIERLLALSPKTARVERGGQSVEIPLEAVAVGDTLLVRPGERIAADGVVLDGRSNVDESALTGEPMPVLKSVEAKVTGGTLNGSGALRVRVEAAGEATVLAEIIRMVEAAQGAKLPVQALVDRVTAVFVPVVMAIALATVAIWLLLGPDPALPFALVAGVSVLIIACPCAMGLATPTSIMVGTGRAAELGVLFRKGDALQALSGVELVAFDKTGTLTEGRPVLTLIEGDGSDFAAIAAVERLSEHPVAHSIVEYAEAKGLDLPDVEDFESVTGMGAKAMVDGKSVIVGARRFLIAEGVDTGSFAASATKISEDGATTVFAAVDGTAVTVLGVSDPVKSTATETVRRLKSEGLEVAMISGDAERTAQVVAAKLGITEVVAGVLPGGKVEAVEAMRAGQGSVAFVGDGINDAPVLAAADIGIALGTGTDVAMEAADVVLVSGDPRGVATALKMSRATMRNIRQNLFWAFAYNAALIPIAAGVLYPTAGILLSPMLAAAAMALSSVFVVSNALRLKTVGAA